MSSFTELQKKFTAQTSQRRRVKAAAKIRNLQSRQKLASYNRAIQESKNYDKLIERPERSGGYKRG